MKFLKYMIVLALFLAAGACKNDETESPVVDPEKRKAFLTQTEMGVYQNGTAEFTFNKETHQLYINPADHVSRIQNNAGIEYFEVRLDPMPTVGGESVKLTLRENVKLSQKPQTVALLKSDTEHLWLWSDETGTGYLVPWIAE